MGFRRLWLKRKRKWVIMPVAEMKLDSKIYVAGHRGLLGSAVHRRLQKEGFRNILVRTSQELDLTDQARTFAFLEKERPEFLFMCAAKVGGIKANMEALGEFMYRNLAIQNNVIEGARLAGVKRLLFVGSSCIYPKVTAMPIQEHQLLSGPLEPTNEGYAIAKIAGVRMCQFYKKQYGSSFIAAIPPNLYGIGDTYDLNSAHVLPALIHKLHLAKKKKEATIEIWGSGKPRREFMLSDDCADALVHLMRHYDGDEPVNVGTGHDDSIVELAEMAAKVIGVKVQFRFDPSKPDGMMRKVMDVSKLKNMGWQPKYPMEEGLAVAYADFLKRYEK